MIQLFIFRDDYCGGCTEVVEGHLTGHIIQCHIEKPLWTLVKSKRNTQKQDQKFHFLKGINALRNSGGGTLLIHSTDPSVNMATGLSYLDEMLDEMLNVMIEDGTPYADSFYRQVSNKNRNILKMTITGSTVISTLNFNTKVSLNDSLREPTLLNMIRLVHGSSPRNELVYSDPPKNSKQEQCDVQFKQLFEPKRNINELANYIFSKLRLREYVAAFANQQRGGVFILGMKEITVKQQKRPMHRKWTAEGFFLREVDQEPLKRKLFYLIKTEMLWLNTLGRRVDRDPNIEFRFDRLRHNPRLWTMSVLVYPVRGVVFYDKEGPEAYIINEPEIQRLPYEEWYWKMKSIEAFLHDLTQRKIPRIVNRVQ